MVDLRHSSYIFQRDALPGKHDERGEALLFPCRKTFGVIGFALLTSFAAVGCGGSTKLEAPVNRSYRNLKLLGRAYIAATNELGRPPKGAEEVLPFITYNGEGGPKAILHTAEGEEYTILWGSLPNDDGGKSFVIAYEPHETDGHRYVLVGRDVYNMESESFKKAPFPPGKAPE